MAEPAHSGFHEGRLLADRRRQERKRKTRREELFLERMDDSIPRQISEDRICPPQGRPGTRPYPLSAMLRSHCVRLFYNLSHPGMDDPPVSRGQALLYESDRVRRFVGLWEDHPRLPRPPDETRTGQGLLEKINAHPKSQG